MMHERKKKLKRLWCIFKSDINVYKTVRNAFNYSHT